MRLKQNVPHHAPGLMGSPREKAPLKAGAHMPMRLTSGFNDSKGYQGSPTRRNGAHTGRAPKFEQGILPNAAKPNAKGTAPPPLGSKPGVRGTPDSHLGAAGRGGTGRIGKGDSYKGQPTKYSEDISHSSFEKLGAD
jgi:hypothetical protein